MTASTIVTTRYLLWFILHVFLSTTIAVHSHITILTRRALYFHSPYVSLLSTTIAVHSHVWLHLRYWLHAPYFVSFSMSSYQLTSQYVAMYDYIYDTDCTLSTLFHSPCLPYQLPSQYIAMYDDTDCTLTLIHRNHYRSTLGHHFTMLQGTDIWWPRYCSCIREQTLRQWMR
jgi:hypothetical protein